MATLFSAPSSHLIRWLVTFAFRQRRYIDWHCWSRFSDTNATSISPCQRHYHGKCFTVSGIIAAFHCVSCIIAANVSLSAVLSHQVFHCISCIIAATVSCIVSLCQLHYRIKCYRGKCFTVSAALSLQVFRCVSCIITANVSLCQLHYRGNCLTVSAALSLRFTVSCIITAYVSLSAALSRQMFHCVSCIIAASVSLCHLHYHGKCFTVSVALSR